MDENIQAMNLNMSMKNIEIPSKFEYQKAFIYRIEDFIKRLRWHCYFIGPPNFNTVIFDKNDENPSSQCAHSTNTPPESELPEFEKQQWYGFKTENTPPVIKELITFENELYKLLRNLKFRKVNDKFQGQMKETIKSVKSSNEILVPADKSPLFYKIPVQMCNKLLLNEAS